MQFLCTILDIDFECEHRFRMFYAPMQHPRTGRFIGSIWVCEQCLNRVDPPKPSKLADLTLFDLTNGENDVQEEGQDQAPRTAQRNEVGDLPPSTQ